MLTICDPFAQPFTVVPSEDLVLVTVDRRAGEHPLLRTEVATAWLQEHAGRHLIVDLTQVTMLNSALVAWLIALATGNAPCRLVVRGACSQVARQIGQLRLQPLLDLG